jgi:DNA-binding NarL/FixJ family response regulator
METRIRLRVAAVGVGPQTLECIRHNIALRKSATFVDEAKLYESIDDFVGRTIPDILVLEINKDFTELEARLAVRSTRAVKRNTEFLYIVDDDLRDHVERIYDGGSNNLIFSSDVPTEFSRAVTVVHGGEKYVSRKIFTMLRSPSITTINSALSDAGAPNYFEESHGELSKREALVLKLIAFGFSTKEIAFELNVSPKTVETYKARASDKLQLHSRAAIVKFCFKNGWFSIIA